MNKRTIKGIRFDLSLTQQEMANKLGVPLNTYRRYENYITKIPVNVLIKIADLAKIENIRSIKV